MENIPTPAHTQGFRIHVPRDLWQSHEVFKLCLRNHIDDLALTSLPDPMPPKHRSKVCTVWLSWNGKAGSQFGSRSNCGPRRALGAYKERWSNSSRSGPSTKKADRSLTSKPWPAYMVVKFLSVAVVAAQLFTWLPCLVFAICSQNVTDTLFNSTRPEKTGIGGGAKSILQRNLQSHGVNYRRDRVVVRQSCHSKPTLPSHTQPQNQRCLTAPECDRCIGWICMKSLYYLTVSCRLTYLKKNVLVLLRLGGSLLFKSLSAGWHWKRSRAKTTDLQRRQLMFMYIYIYIHVQVIFTYIYISFHTYHTIFAKGQWLKVRERVPLLPLLFRSPSPCGEKMLSLCLSNLQIQSICFLEDFWGPRAVTEHKLYCRILCKGKMADVSKQLVRTTTHTQLH